MENEQFLKISNETTTLYSREDTNKFIDIIKAEFY